MSTVETKIASCPFITRQSSPFSAAVSWVNQFQKLFQSSATSPLSGVLAHSTPGYSNQRHITKDDTSFLSAKAYIVDVSQSLLYIHFMVLALPSVSATDGKSIPKNEPLSCSPFYKFKLLASSAAVSPGSVPGTQRLCRLVNQSLTLPAMARVVKEKNPRVSGFHSVIHHPDHLHLTLICFLKIFCNSVIAGILLKCRAYSLLPAISMIHPRDISGLLCHGTSRRLSRVLRLCRPISKTARSCI